jgi:hypothetical protein
MITIVGTDATLYNNTQRCNRCGGLARVVEGTFDVSSAGVFTQKAGKPVDAEIFTRIGLILTEAKLENLKPHEIVEKIAPHSSELAVRLRRVADDPQAFAVVLAALIGAFAAIAVAVVSSGSPSKTEVDINIHQNISPEKGHEALETMRREGRHPPPWSSDYI